MVWDVHNPLQLRPAPIVGEYGIDAATVINSFHFHDLLAAAEIVRMRLQVHC